MSRASGRQRARWADPRVWVAVVITAVTLALALRGISFSAVAGAMARADLLLLVAGSVPAYAVMVYLRARRWGHLTDAVAPIARGPLFRATAVGFMANNVFPLRVGELARTWILARETGTSAAAIFGTVVLERVIDAVVVVALAATLLGLQEAGTAGGSLAVGVPLLMAAVVPALAVGILRAFPEPTIRLAGRVLGLVLPLRITRAVEATLARIAEGLGSLQGGWHLLWIAVDSALLWLVISPIPFLVGFAAMDLDLGPPGRTLLAAYTTLVAVGIAVAVPSAPGFFGPYHWACREALTRFGVSADEAVALGTLVHGLFWVSLTALGLVVLRRGATRLEDLSEAAADPGKDPPAHRR